jgi:acyl-CoA synthetase (AMP-forming)/AMP-acid ligase II/acyl carrier protein
VGFVGLGQVLARERGASASVHAVDSPAGDVDRLATDAAARRIAASLERSEQRGARILVALPPDGDYFAAFFGCLYAGMIPVPVPPPSSGRRLARLKRIVDACGATRLICGADGMANAASLGLRLDGLEALAAGEPMEPAAAEPDDVAYLQFTSGSTALPRGVKVTHRAALANIAAFQERVGGRREGWVVSWLPLHHDLGLMTALMAIDSDLGLALLTPEQFIRRPWSWLEAISRHRACFSGAPTFAYEALCRSPEPAGAEPLDLRCWTMAFCGAEQVRGPVMRRFARRFSAVGLPPNAITPGYGLAEFTLLATAVHYAEPIAFRAPRAAGDKGEAAREYCDVGPAIAGHRLLVADPASLRPLPEGEVGEVLLDGPSKGSGYWGLEEESRRTFEAAVPGHPGGFLRTGDLGFLQGGRLHLVGRSKEIVIVRGRNLHPEEVEEVARAAHPALRGAAAAFAMADDAGLGLLCEMQLSGRRARPEELIRSIQRDLAHAFGINASLIALVRAGGAPRTTSGKLLRLQCEGLLASGDVRPLMLWRADGSAAAQRTVAGERPDRAEIRAWIAAFLSLRLGVAANSLGDGEALQDVGLDSMGAVELAYALEDWLRVPVEPTIVWQAPTVGELAGLLARRIDDRPGDTVEPGPARIGIVGESRAALLRPGRVTAGTT